MTETVPSTHKPSWWDKIWRDKHGSGRVVIAQLPNWPLLVWLGLTVIAQYSKGQLSSGAALAATVVLIMWAGLEVLAGVNYFRRGLGAVVLLFSIASLYKNIFS